jgi:GTP cyclohydrolase I
VETLFRKLILEVGEEPDREGLIKTPTRAAQALQELTKGYHQDIHKIINGALFSSPADEMVVVKDIEFYSLCEHHLLPFFGICHVGYLPHGKVLGLSKIPRIVDTFARRLQIQESLTQQIATAILEHTQAHGVGVILQAQHLCMMMRGVCKQNALMKTSCMLGSFRRDKSTRAEFLSLIGP